jgi:hypothetical protein
MNFLALRLYGHFFRDYDQKVSRYKEMTLGPAGNRTEYFVNGVLLQFRGRVSPSNCRLVGNAFVEVR